jgi:asparagine synthase (glutamine-hydrolysing)
MERPIQRVVDLTDPSSNRLRGITVEEARARVALGDPGPVRAIAGSYALVAAGGEIVRMARSLDRPLRYFLAKQVDGPMLVAADRIDAIRAYLERSGLSGQFHPSYTRMVPAHHVATLRLIGCPDPAATYERFLEPAPAALPADAAEIGRLYVGALADEVTDWLESIPAREPVGVCFSGGVDSGAVFLVAYHVLRRLGQSPSRLKAFTLSAGEGPDLAQARRFLAEVSLDFFLESIETTPESLDPFEAVRVVEDYKPLDVEAAAAALALARGIRERYPDWRFLLDGDGGDENLKDYPLEKDGEVTIKSVIANPLLYQEGWGVGKLKHSLTYTGGQSRSCTRTYAPLRRHGFEGFSPFLRPRLVELAASIPFAELTGHDVERLYRLKGEIVATGVEAVTGLRMPVYPKRRFQDGVGSEEVAAARWTHREADYRSHFHSLYA